jgi:hypothetical protein
MSQYPPYEECNLGYAHILPEFKNFGPGRDDLLIPPSIIPPHLSCHIEHNPHKDFYQTVEQYLTDHVYMNEDMSTEDLKECVEKNELWTIQVYPQTPIGFYFVGASTFKRALFLINEIMKDEN